MLCRSGTPSSQLRYASLQGGKGNLSMEDKEAVFESATRDVLLSAAKLLTGSCVDAELAFTKCKDRTSDPEACLKLGLSVLECGTGVLKKAATKCPEEFEAYRKCMDRKQMKFGLCRPQEAALLEAFSSD